MVLPRVQFLEKFGQILSYLFPWNEITKIAYCVGKLGCALSATQRSCAVSCGAAVVVSSKVPDTGILTSQDTVDIAVDRPDAERKEWRRAGRGATSTP